MGKPHVNKDVSKGERDDQRSENIHIWSFDANVKKIDIVRMSGLKQSAEEITDLFNTGRNRTFSKRTIERKLHDDGYHKWTVKKAIRIRAVNKKNRVAWCRGNLHKTVDAYWNKIILSDECKVIIGQDTRVRVRRKAEE